jgi:serine/threonine protein kinase
VVIDSPDTLVAALLANQLLSADQLEEAQRLGARLGGAQQLARELVRRGWLTPFQVNRIFQGRSDGLLLGQYILLERLGEGGMGVVFKARHRLLDRLAALKCIRKEVLATHTIERFQREVRAAARLSHPNVVLIHDADEHLGTHFYAMEYIEGTDLARVVKGQGPLPLGRACEYVRQAALGLHHIHGQGLVHRDIKPSNLMLTADGQTVKVLDLGLALLGYGTAGEEDPTRAITAPQVLMGTPDYLAPEQARNAHDVDGRADLYSLGCTLYHLLAGRPPFPSGSPAEKVAWHLHAEPPGIERLRTGLPEELTRLVATMMAKDPGNRPPTGAAVAEALAAFVSMNALVPPAQALRGGESVGSVPPLSGQTLPATDPTWAQTTAERKTPQRPTRSRRRSWAGRLVLVAGAGLCLVIAFLMIRGTDADRHPEDPTIPDQRKNRARTTRQHIEAAKQLMTAREFQSALREAEAAAVLSPTDFWAHYHVALAACSLLDGARALAAADRALGLAKTPDLNERAHLVRGAALSLRKEYLSAWKEFGLAFNSPHPTPKFLLAQGRELLDNGNPGIAFTLFDLVAETQRADWGDPRALRDEASRRLGRTPQVKRD